MSDATLILLAKIIANFFSSSARINIYGTVGFGHFTTYYYIQKNSFNIFNRLEMRVPDHSRCRKERLYILQSNTTEHFNPLFREPMTLNILKGGVKISRTVNI